MADTKVAPRTGAEKVIEFLEGRPAKTGPELVKALRLSGTPDEKLKAAREAMHEAHEAGKMLTAAEVLKVMEAAEISESTLEKARSLIATGRFKVAGREELSIEDKLLSLAEKPAPKK